MPLQHPSLTKTYLAATTAKATNLEGKTSSISVILAEATSPPPHQISSPLLRTWPSPLHIREPPAYKWLASCPNAWRVTSETVRATEHSAGKKARKKN